MASTWYPVFIVLYMIYWGVGDMIYLLRIPSKLSQTLPHIGLPGPPSVSDQAEGRPAGQNLEKEPV